MSRRPPTSKLPATLCPYPTLSLSVAEAADLQRTAAEGPRAQAEPAEVFHCVAAMRKFPVEHAAQSLLIHQQIAGAKITVNNARQRWCRLMRTQPREEIGRASCRERVCQYG